MASGVYSLHVQYAMSNAVQCENVLNYEFFDLDWLSTPGPNAFLSAIDTALTPKYLAILRPTDQLIRYRLVSTSHDDPGGPPNTAYDLVKGVFGTRSSIVDMTPEFTGILNFHTPTVGRSFRGWMFLPPPYTSSVFTGTTWNAGTNWVTACTALQTELTRHVTGGAFWIGAPAWLGQLVVYSKTRRKRGETPWKTPVNSISFNPHPTWLRSRRN